MCLVLGEMAGKSVLMNVLHSVMDYPGFGGVQGMRGTMIGWLGDRSKWGEPNVRLLPPKCLEAGQGEYVFQWHGFLAVLRQKG